MEVRNCKDCGRIFNYLSGPPLCPSCLKELDLKFEEVREYIYEHPRVGVQEVSEVCDVSVKQIKQWVREERLTFAEDSMVGLDCEKCGVLIKTGRYCKSCKNELAQGFKNLYPEKHKKPDKNRDSRENPRMRFLDN